MSTFLIFRPEDIPQHKDPYLACAHYVRQNLGTPGMSKQDLVVFRKKANVFFSENPQCNWYTICRVVGWCKNRHKRPPKIWSLFSFIPYAWADGAVPELDPDHVDLPTEEAITAALEVESDPVWRRKLLVAQGRTARAEALAEWRGERSWQS